MRQSFKRFARHRRWGWHITLSLPLLAGTPAAFAVDDDLSLALSSPDTVRGFTPYVSYETVHDSNVLGLPNTATAEASGAGSSLEDNWHKLMVGVKFDDILSEQHLLADVNIGKVNFDRLQQLNHDDKYANFDWNWHTVDHVQGNLIYNYQEDLTPFIDFHLLAPNLRTQQSAAADISWLFLPSWRVRAGYTDYHIAYDLASQQSLNRDEGRTELGLDYVAASGSTAGVQLRHIAATFPVPQEVGTTLVSSNYGQDEVKAKIDWNYSAITQVHFLGGWVKRSYDVFPERNFSGPNARLTVNWLPTKLLSFTVAGWREIGSVDDLTAAYSLNHGISAEAVWSISEKLKLDGLYKYERQDFSQAATINEVPFLSDAMRSGSIMLTYKATRKLQLQASIVRVVQNQYDPNSGFSSNSEMLNCRYEF